MKFLLLGTAGCHLCEQAEAIIKEAVAKTPDIQLVQIDIAEQMEWQSDYGLHIPVILHEVSARTLFWPFDGNHVINFFESLR